MRGNQDKSLVCILSNNGGHFTPPVRVFVRSISASKRLFNDEQKLKSNSTAPHVWRGLVRTD